MPKVFRVECYAGELKPWERPLEQLSGRERDAFIAHAILGYRRVHQTHHGAWCGWKPTTRDIQPADSAEPYTTDLTCMHHVLNVLSDHIGRISLTRDPKGVRLWECRNRLGSAVGEAAPLALYKFILQGFVTGAFTPYFVCEQVVTREEAATIPG